MVRQQYPTDLTDRQWSVLQPLLSAAKPGGRPRSVDLREIPNAIFYIDRNGTTWRAPLHDFPPWRTVSHSFRAWRRDGTWARISDALRDRVRPSAGRPPSPRAAIIDRQSVKTTKKKDPRV